MVWQLIGISIIAIGTILTFLKKENSKFSLKKFNIWGTLIIAVGMAVSTIDSYISQKKYESKISYLVEINNKKHIEDSISKIYKLKYLQENLIAEINLNLNNINEYQKLQDKIDKNKNIIDINLNNNFMKEYLNETKDSLLRNKIQYLISHSDYTNEYLSKIYAQKANMARTKNIYTLDTLILENRNLSIEVLELLNN